MKHGVIAGFFVRSSPAAMAFPLRSLRSIQQVHQDCQSVEPGANYGDVQNYPEQGEIHA